MKLARITPIVAVLAACHAAPEAKPPTAVDGVAAGQEAEPEDPRRANLAFAVESPLSLTASDGTGLSIRELRASAVVDGSLAFTELTLSFDNPSDRTLEGTFRIALPRGASLGRFAMKVNGEWQEGEVVELEAARRAYEDFLHRKQDPALMEKAAGNEFSARVFPIPARGTKEIVVAYVEEVRGAEYTLPLKGLPELGNLAVDVKILGANKHESLRKRAFAPPSDFLLPLPKQEGSVRSGDLAIIRVEPQTDSRPDPLDNVLVLVDTSASRVLGFDEELKAVETLVTQITGNVTVAAFDQKVSPVYSGSAKGFGGRELGALKARDALGASNLEAALTFAKDNAKKQKARRVVLVTDGVVTAGATDAKKLLPRVTALKEAGVERIDAIGIGGIRDDVMLGQIVRGTLAHDGVVADVGNMAHKLGEATRSGIPVKVEGATWSWPTKLDGVQAGDTYSVYATLPESAPLRVSFDKGTVRKVEARVTERPLVERAVSQARIASMLERETTEKASLRKEITSLAVKQRIMTPYTAMLVLETEQDYARFGIKRTSLADVLAIRDGNVQRLHRDSMKVATSSSDVDARNDRADLKKRDAAEKEESKPKPSAGAVAAADGPRPPRPPPLAQAAPTPRSVPEPMEAPKAEKAAEAPREARAESRPATPSPSAAAPRSPRPARAASADDAFAGEPSPRGNVDRAPAYEGRFKDVMERIAAKRFDEARNVVNAWRKESAGDVLALVALGEIAEAQGNLELAARAYGSVIDLFSNRADLRRFAGERLERIGMKDDTALELAIDSFEKAFADRPDHPSSARLLTFALVRHKEYARAFEVAVSAARRGYEVDCFAGIDRILREDIGLVGAVWAKAEPTKREQILSKVISSGGQVEGRPSIRFVLNWETDANDVDFHIHDSKGGHAFYASPRLRSGGELYADVTTGYGPECFTVRSQKMERPTPYHLDAHYYSRGPMGYGMGKLEVIDHDGAGNLIFDERPFIVMVDGAFVDLGEVHR